MRSNSGKLSSIDLDRPTVKFLIFYFPFLILPMVWLELIPPVGLHVSLVAVWLAIVVLTTEILYRYTATDPEILRKIVHIGTGNVILLAWWLNIPAWIGIAAAILASIVALLSYWLPLLPGVNSVGRKSLGTFFYAISIGISIAWFWPIASPEYAALGILIMAWGDGMAALIGQRFGRHPYQVWGMNKSWEGSIAMCSVSAIVSSWILVSTHGNHWQTWSIAIAVALAATALETFSKLGLDNLTVPIGSAALAFWLIS
jgi:phytol kinase